MESFDLSLVFPIAMQGWFWVKLSRSTDFNICKCFFESRNVYAIDIPKNDEMETKCISRYQSLPPLGEKPIVSKAINSQPLIAIVKGLYSMP